MCRIDLDHRGNGRSQQRPDRPEPMFAGIDVVDRDHHYGDGRGARDHCRVAIGSDYLGANTRTLTSWAPTLSRPAANRLRGNQS